MNKMIAMAGYNNAIEGTTVSKIAQVILLYDAIVQYCLVIQSAMVAKDSAQAYNAMVKCQKIIEGLAISLDMEKGGDVAIALQNFYDEIGIALYQSVIKNQPKYCDFVITQVRTMRSVWQEIKDAGH